MRVFRVPPAERSELDRFVEDITGRAPPPVGRATYLVVRESYLFAQEIQGKPLDSRLRRATDVTPRHFLSEAGWDPADHPRGGYPQNRGWFSPTAGGGRGGAASASRGDDGFSAPDRADRRRLGTIDAEAPKHSAGARNSAVGNDDHAAANPKGALVSLKSPDAKTIWSGAVISAQGQRLPTALLDWNLKNKTTIAHGSTPKYQPGRFYGGTLYLDQLNIDRLTRIGTAGKFDPEFDVTGLESIYNEAFHAWFAGNKASLGWLHRTMGAQKQFGADTRFILPCAATEPFTV